MQSTSDSIRNEVKMARRGKPTARRVPISRPRLETAAYIVLAAANIAPTVKNPAMI